MAFLIVLGVLLLLGVVAVVRHSRSFKGYREHYAVEESPEPRLSRGWAPSQIDDGSGGGAA